MKNIITDWGLRYSEAGNGGDMLPPSGSRKQREETLLGLAEFKLSSPGSSCVTWKCKHAPPPTLSITDPWPPAGASHWLTSMGSQEIREQGCAFHGSSFLVTEQGQEEKEERRGTEDNQDGASDQTKETGRAGSLSDILRCWGGADQALVSVYRLGLYWGPSPGGRSCECRRTKPQEAFYRKKKKLPLAALVQKINNS